MKTIASIALVMENEEIIYVKKSEIKDLNIAGITSDIVKIGQQMVEVDNVSDFEMILDVSANHTYNSFGRVSTSTIFDRILDRDALPIVGILVHYATADSRVLYFPNGIEERFDIDHYGDMRIACHVPFDAEDDEDGDCPCCCEGD